MRNNCQVYLRLSVLALALHQAVGQLDYLYYDETHIVGKVSNIVESIVKGLTVMDGRTRILYLMDVMRQRNQRR